MGLSKITEEITGKNLCKIDTFSDWDKRPLSLFQQHYAAVDAYILLKLYQKLSDVNYIKKTHKIEKPPNCLE